MGNDVREVIFFKRYFDEFFDKQPKKVQEKLYHSIKLLKTIPKLPREHLKALPGTDGLLEMRTQLGSNIYRVFCFFDKGNIVVLMNGFQKKTQKTPRNEIKLALKIREEYYAEK
ncbi:MAG TPA: type II toxin-antitoxin system RelE/ParE family toxin [Pyrinomonadaceae bacterium]|nr:type II toxin-antitoxin system RelE/ParE family toxin [Pyrinomonadaceae bacterium]